MVVNSHRHNLFRVILSDYIVIQTFFDLMRCRDLADIQNRLLFLFLFWFFLLYFLLVAKWQIGHVYKLDIRHLST